MVIKPQVLFGNVAHRRLFPRQNAFSYGIYYIGFPLSRMRDMAQGWRFGVNAPGLMGFHEKDHGVRDGTSLADWIAGILQDAGVAADGDVALVAMPRVLGHGFNPVSFWLCHDKAGELRAVVCEVHNTFGETHSYICRPADGSVINADTWLQAEKVFHVSPFLPREGQYKFRFSITEEKLGVWIDYYAADGRKQLQTVLTGTWAPMTRATLRRAFWRYPLVAVVALARIHWHAAKLLFKGVRYVPKPPQREKNTSLSAPPETTTLH